MVILDFLINGLIPPIYFISAHIDKLYDMLDDKGTLFFHISSSCMFIPESILRNNLIVEPIFWKNVVLKIM